MSPIKPAHDEREIELKLSAPPEVLDKLRGAGQWTSLLQAVQGRAVSEKLRSVYYDTKAFDLRAKGIALRLRHHATHSIQTVKTVPGKNEIAPMRDEYEARLEDGESTPDPQLVPNKHVRKQLRHVAAKAPLNPVFETAVHRTTRALRTREGDEIELAIDIGEIRSKDAHAPISEIELELKSGARTALYQLARQLVRNYPLRLRLQSKAARGYALIAGETVGAVKASNLALNENDTVEVAFESILRHCLQHFLANEPAVIESQSPSGVHQMRVALRRLRSAFKLFGSFCEGHEARHLEHEAQILARRLGDVRDLDVFVSDTLAFAKENIGAHAIGLSALEEQAAHARTEAWEKIIAIVSAPRFMTFVLDLALFIETREWRRDTTLDATLFDVPIKQHATDTLSQALKKINKLGRELKSLDEDSRHLLRKRLKRLRYATDFFGSLYDEADIRSYSRKLSKLQDAFGLLNDIATADTLLPFLVRNARAQLSSQGEVTDDNLREAAQAIAKCNGDRRDKNLTALMKQWRSLAQAIPYWQH